MDWIVYSSILSLALNSENILRLLPKGLLLHSICRWLLIVALIRKVIVDGLDWIGLWVKEFLFLFAIRFFPLLFIENALLRSVAPNALDTYWLVEENLKDLWPTPSALLLDHQSPLEDLEGFLGTLRDGERTLHDIAVKIILTVTVVRQSAKKQLKEEYTQRPDISLRCVLSVLQHLWRHVDRSTHTGPGHFACLTKKFGETEVTNFKNLLMD